MESCGIGNSAGSSFISVDYFAGCTQMLEAGADFLVKRPLAEIPQFCDTLGLGQRARNLQP